MKRYFIMSASIGSLIAAGSANAQSVITSGTDPVSTAAQASGTSAQAGAARSTSEPQPPESGDIIVTAQKRSESVQNVPISISAFGGEALRAANVTQISDLTRLVPTFNYGTSPGTVGTRYGIRGLSAVGNSAIEPSVATFLDGVYVPRAGSLSAGLLDIDTIEVLSGPQGTLFGRNASVGAISITTALPTDTLQTLAAAEIGTGERYRGELVLNVPVSDRLAFRFAGLGEAFGGFWRYLPTGKRFGGIDTVSTRLTGRLKISDNITWIVRGDYLHQGGNNYQNVSVDPKSITPTIFANFSRILGGRLPIIGLDSNDSLNDPSTGKVNDYHWGVSSTLNFDTDSGFAFKLIDSYRRWRAQEQDGEVTFLPVPLLDRAYLYDSKSDSHELQIVSPLDKLLGGRLSFVGGLYYYHEKLDINYDYNLRAEWCSTAVAAFAPSLVAACNAGIKNAGFYNRFPQTTRSYAAYAQATITIVPRVNLTLGGRFTHESKDASYLGVRVNPSAVFGTNENSSLNYSDNRFTERVNLSWKPSRDLLFFSTYSTGFKAGGFNAGASNTVLGTLREFGPELVKNYELGAKTQFLDRRVTADVTLYRMDVQGFQERALLNAASVVRNVGSIRSQGVEATFAATPVSWLRLNASVAYLNSKFTSYPNAPALPWLTGVQDLTGARPTFAPRWTTSFGAEIRHEFAAGYRATLRTDVNTVSSQNENSANDNSPIAIQNAYALLSMRLSLFAPGDKFSLAVFGQNLTDKHYCSNYGYQVLGAQLGAVDPGHSEAIDCFHASPRTIGLRLGLKM